MKKIITVANQKGGVAKTATSIHLAASAARDGYKVILIDADPQANASLGLSVKPRDFEYGTSDIFDNPNISLEAALYKTKVDNLYLVPSDQSLARVEWEMWQNYEPQYSMIIKNKADQLKGDYIIVIDTPPSLGIFTINALTAATGVIVPVTPDPYAIIGLKYLQQTIDDIRFSVNKKLKILGFVKTMWDERSNLAREIGSQLEDMFLTKLFKTPIKINVRLKEAAIAGMPVYDFEPSASSSIAYQELYKEVSERW